MFGLDSSMTILLVICLLAACAFEFINGFHDTANAVATVIYTNSLKPRIAVIWSGIWNVIGVYVGGVTVAMGIIALLPLDILMDNNLYHNIALILSLILTAIIWNLWTWYLGIPCSSSHTLIGSIFGVGLVYMLFPGHSAVTLNWQKVEDIGLSLLISPIFGFSLALMLMVLLKRLVKDKKNLKKPPSKDAPPPRLIRAILILTCTSVSFSHGSNDGQKGIGLVMIILIAFAPTFFALDRTVNPSQIDSTVQTIQAGITGINMAELNLEDQISLKILTSQLDSFHVSLSKQKSKAGLNGKESFIIRKNILVICKMTEKILPSLKPLMNEAGFKELKSKNTWLRSTTEYVPNWVIIMIGLSLGIGTMIGWKKIVITIGEKIGKTHLTYAQGAISELVAASTILASSSLGLPVSTTHVLSSGVAGSMVATNGLKNLRKKTIRNIAVAWIVTLPVTIILSGGMFYLLRLVLV